MGVKRVAALLKTSLGSGGRRLVRHTNKRKTRTKSVLISRQYPSEDADLFVFMIRGQKTDVVVAGAHRPLTIKKHPSTLPLVIVPGQQHERCSSCFGWPSALSPQAPTTFATKTLLKYTPRLAVSLPRSGDSLVNDNYTTFPPPLNVNIPSWVGSPDAEIVGSRIKYRKSS
uniref:Uncharacterized protein n=2 Tax=Plectus sambesii TaxID=2011161 RepID=A0A914W7G9_9BILA